MRLSLKEMIAQTISQTEARAKIAQARITQPPMPAPSTSEQQKQAATSLSGELVEKVASALDYVIQHMDEVDWEKVAEEVGPGYGPGSLENNESGMPTEEQPKDFSTSSPNAIPLHPSMESNTVDPTPQGRMKTNEGDGVMKGVQPQITNNAGTKVAALRTKLAMQKVALGLPAHYSAGPEPHQAPYASASGEKDIPLSGEVASRIEKALGSNQAAINLTKTEAKSPEAAFMNGLLEEPVHEKTKDPAVQKSLETAKQASMVVTKLREKLASHKPKDQASAVQRLAARMQGNGGR